MNFFSSSKPTSNSTFGYKVNSIDGIPSNLEMFKGKILKTNKIYRDEITKYREIAAFNQQLSKGYIRNLEAMVDVSRLLNYYVEIINTLRDEFEKNDKVLGTSLTPADISYLESLTKSKIDDLNNRFMSESEKLKKMYNQYGQTQELARVVEAQNNLMATTNAADQTMTKIRQQVQNVESQRNMFGGSMTKISNSKPRGVSASKHTKKSGAKPKST